MTKTIRDWESYISDYFSHVSILGEIPLSQTDFDSIAQEIRALHKRTGNKLGETTNRLVAYYPRLFVTFLAHFAAHNTRRDFWDALGSLLQMPGANFHAVQWHTRFIYILEDHGIKTFQDVGADTNKYVTAMRIHGGIPAYSLPDFFERMLLPAVTQNRYTGLQGQELLDALLARSEAQLFMDSPVRNFFENSGSLGLDLLNECVLMAYHYRQTGWLPDELTLPAYIRDKFVEFMEERPEKLGLVRLKRPRLLFDPEGDGFLIELPEQPISGSQAGIAYWQFDWDQQTTKEYVRPRRLGRDIITESRQVVFNRAISQVSLSFWLQSEEDEPPREQHRWNISLRPSPGAPPLLAFRSADGSLLRGMQTLPPETLLLLHPMDVQLKFDGNGELQHQCRSLRGILDGWQADYWSLENAWRLYLVRNGQDVAIFPVGRRIETPTLIGSDPWPMNADPKGTLLYVGVLPHLHIPLPIGADPANEITRWHITIESVWEAEPVIHKNDCHTQLQVMTNSLELDLARVLGDKPVGTYNLHVTNYRDVDVEYRFRLWPSIQVQKLPEIILPSVDASSTNVQFQLILPTEATCHSQAGAEGIQSKGNLGRYTITLDANVTRADLLLTIPAIEARTPIQVPIFIPIPRLQWRLVTGDDSVVQWSTKPFQRSVDAFMQSSKQSLLLRMPGLGKFASSLSLVLVDSNNPQNVLQKFAPEVDKLDGNYLRFALPAAATLNASFDSSAFNFDLILPNSTNGLVHLPLLSLTRTLQIYNVRLECIEETEFALLWDEPHPLRNRRVFLRPLWQPWNNGQEFVIPDQARGKFHIQETSLPYSRYEACFYIAPSWKEALITPPDTSDKFYFNTIDSADYLRLLGDQIHKNHQKAFRCYFESACIYAEQGAKDQLGKSIDQCIDSLPSANLGMILAFYRWLENNQSINREDIRLKMLSPILLGKLYDEQGNNASFRRSYLGDVTQVKILDPKSAQILLEHEDDVLLVLHCLRNLLRCHDPEGVKWIIKMIEEGSLSDDDATDLFVSELDFSLKQLAAGVPDPICLRQFSNLLLLQKEPSKCLANLPTEHLTTLANTEEQADLCCLYASELLERKEPIGVQRIMDLFQKARLGGHEVTELLSTNPSFSLQILSADPENQANQVQISELLRKFPEQLVPSTAETTNPRIPLSEDDQWIELIRLGKREGFQKILAQVQLGKIKPEKLLTLLAANPVFSYRFLTGSHNVIQHVNTITQLARKFPIETQHVTPGMLIKTPGGWGRIEKITNAENIELDIAQVGEPDIILGLTLRPQLHPEMAVLDIGNTKLIFPKAKQLFVCTLCKEFLTAHKDILLIHFKEAHKTLKPAWREHNSSSLPVFRPYEIQDNEAQRDKMSRMLLTRRDNLSLLLASLSNKQLINLAEASETKYSVAQACWAILIKRGEDDSVKKILSQLHYGKISNEQALNLLGSNPEFAYSYLNELPLTQRPIELINTLVARYPVETMHIKPGMFIHTPAGWGEIISIRDARNTLLDASPVDVSNITIQLILHPTDHPEPLIVNLLRGVCSFPTKRFIYKCMLTQVATETGS